MAVSVGPKPGGRFWQLTDDTASGADVELARATELSGVRAARAVGVSGATQPPPAVNHAKAAASVSLAAFWLITLGTTGTFFIGVGLIRIFALPKAASAFYPRPPPLPPPAPPPLPPPLPPPPEQCVALAGRTNLRDGGKKLACHDALAGGVVAAAACVGSFVTACSEEPCAVPLFGSGPPTVDVSLCVYDSTAGLCLSSQFTLCERQWLFAPAPPPPPRLLTPPAPPPPSPCNLLVGRSNLRSNGRKATCHDVLDGSPDNPEAACRSAYITSCNTEPCGVPTNTEGEQWCAFGLYTILPLLLYIAITGGRGETLYCAIVWAMTRRVPT